MSLVTDQRREISRCINTLRRRHANTADESEKQAIAQSIEALTDTLSVLNQAALLDAATALADATDAVESAIAAAKTGPFDGYLAAIEEHFRNLQVLAGELHADERLPAAPDVEPRAARAPAAARGRSARVKARGGAARAAPRGGAAVASARIGPPATMPGGLNAPQPITDFAGLKDEYQAYFDACTVRPERKGVVAFCVNRLDKGRPVYEEVGTGLGGIPWAFIGIIHGMESSFNFAGHLHNGDPLTARTVQVPAGRPKTGSPPFAWRQSATDVLTMKAFHQVADWSVPHMLFMLERFNGLGYRRRSLPTPYLWSLSNLYEKGKFVADGKFDPEAVSKQCGAAVMLKAVLAA